MKVIEEMKKHSINPQGVKKFMADFKNMFEALPED